MVSTMISTKQRQEIAIRYLMAMQLPLHTQQEEQGHDALRRIMVMATPMTGSLSEESFIQLLAERLEDVSGVSHEHAVTFSMLAYGEIISGFRPQQEVTAS